MNPAPRTGFRLDQYIVVSGLVPPEELARAACDKRETGHGGDPSGTGVVMGWVDDGVLPEATLRSFLEEKLGVRLLRDSELNPTAEALKRVPAGVAFQHGILPLEFRGDVLIVACADPFNLDVLDLVSQSLRVPIDGAMASESVIGRQLRRHYGSVADRPPTVTGSDEPAANRIVGEGGGEAGDGRDAPVVRLVEKILEDAFQRGASDIHLEPMASRFRIRQRIDGKLREAQSPPPGMGAALVARLKVLSGMNIAQKRIPQDGRIRLRLGGRDLDFRVGSIPSLHGESLVIRILETEEVHTNFSDLGLCGDDRRCFEEVVSRPDGLVLVTGPTGCGKTTTLYTVLKRINHPGRKIITVEDPVEYRMHGINQVQVRPETGMTFARALRAILRQSPDVVMIGEIRDLETAAIAVKAALTGHLVLSTLHTRDAAGAILRLREIGIEPFLLASALRGVLAQRLVRRNCSDCSRSCTPGKEEMRFFPSRFFRAPSKQTFMQGKGCSHCGGTGFSGRTGIFELLPFSSVMERHLAGGTDVESLRRVARESGVRSLLEDGFIKAAAGVTTLAEVAGIAWQEET